MNSDFMKWFRSIPPMTRYLTGGTFTMSVLMTYHIVNPYSVLLVYERVLHLQIWRLITTFMYAGTFSQFFFFSIIMCYFTCQRVDEYFEGRQNEELSLVFFNAICVMIFSALYGNSVALHHSFIFSLIYTMSKLTPDMEVSIWGFPVRAANLPWVLMFLSVIQGGDPVQDIIGVAAGHCYIYAKTVLPTSHGYKIIDKMHPRA
jgi:Derlin-2/3